MSVIVRGTTKSLKIVYPAGCKEVTDELGKDELVRRLKLIARAFQDMGQEETDEFSGLALHLASEYFMNHNNKDVRLLVACCIADVFRIFAPEAPYRDVTHLKEIFMFLNKQLRGLEDPTSPTFKRYFYLLENLAWVKSFNICIELDDNQEVFCSLFKLMFSIINDKHTTKVKNFMLDMMCPLLTEADNVSQELLDILLINIVEPHKTQHREAYQLAKDLLMRTSDAIEPYVQAFFNNALMLGKTSESDLSDHLYDLIYELNCICPTILLAVLPQLEFKLKSNEESERKSVTKILAKMFSHPGSTLAEQNKPLWICFLGRFNDISISVRTVCVQSVMNFVLYHPELLKDVVEQVKMRQHDAEETVRQEVVNTLLNIAKKNFDCMVDDLLDIVKERTRDKKFKIRREALVGLAHIYKTVTNSEDVSQAQLNKILFVKDKVFHGYYQANPEDKLVVERLFNICLVPYTLSVMERMRRLFLMYATLDAYAVKAFGEMMKYRCQIRLYVKQLLEGIEEQKVNADRQFPFHAKLHQIAKSLPDPQKALDQLKRFNNLLRDDKRLRTMIGLLVGAECTCEKANDTVKDILKKLGGSGPGSTQSQMLLYNTVKSLLERIAPVMIDANALTVLVRHIEDAVKGQGTISDGIDSAAEKGVQLLLCLSLAFPSYFRSKESFNILIDFLNDENEDVADLTLQIITNAGHQVERQFPDVFAKLLPILQHTAKIGSPKQSKHAIRCIRAISRNKDLHLTPVFEHVKNNLTSESANFITSIVALGHISYLCPQEFVTQMKSIVSKNIVKDLLMMDRTSGVETTESWYGDHLVTEETHAKVQAMKLLVRWLLGLKNNNNNSGMSTMRLLYTVIVHEGDLMEKNMINKPELARLRLTAGCCVLRLAEEPVFADLLSRDQFQAIALLINDSCYHVRLKFGTKLQKGLMSLRLPLEYMSVFCLAANDPLRERRTQIKKCIQFNIQKRREYLKQNPVLKGKMFQYLPDYVMPYTIHLLSHDPDLRSFDHISALKNIKECLWFIMEPLVARSEDYNYHFFRRIIENIKQTRDAQGPEDDDMNKKLYAVCDVALGLLATNLTKIVLKDSTVDPVLPSSLFTKPDKETPLNTQVYLPKDFNFDKKKGMTFEPEPTPTAQGAYVPRGQRTQSKVVETIMVESPGPVINPNATAPREPKKISRKAKKDEESDKESSTETSQDGIQSESSQSTETSDVSDTTQQNPAKNGPSKPPTRRGARKAAAKNTEPQESSSQSSVSTDNSKDSQITTESDSQEPMDTSQESAKDTSSQDSTESAQPKKKVLKRTPAASGKVKKATGVAGKRAATRQISSDISEKDDKSQRGAKGAPKGGGKGSGKRAAEESDITSEEEASPNKRVRVTSEDDSSGNVEVAKRRTKKVVKALESEDESSQSSQKSSPSVGKPSPSVGKPSPFKSPTTAALKSTKSAKAKAAAISNKARATVTRSVVKPKSPASSPRSTPTTSPAGTPRKATPTKSATPTKKRAQKLTIKMSNVRRARPLSNGVSSEDTDSSSQAKKAKAIQKGKTAAAAKQTKKKPVAKGKKK